MNHAPSFAATAATERFLRWSFVVAVTDAASAIMGLMMTTGATADRMTKSFKGFVYDDLLILQMGRLWCETQAIETGATHPPSFSSSVPLMKML